MTTIRLALLLQLFLLGFAGAVSATTPQSGIDRDRLLRAYVLLKSAEQMLSGGVVLADVTLQAATGQLTNEALKKECSTIISRCQSFLASPRVPQRAEAFAYLKNACLRLTRDREEPHKGHIIFAQAEPAKALAQTRENASKIQKALNSM